MWSIEVTRFKIWHHMRWWNLSAIMLQRCMQTRSANPSSCKVTLCWFGHRIITAGQLVNLYWLWVCDHIRVHSISPDLPYLRGQAVERWSDPLSLLHYQERIYSSLGPSFARLYADIFGGLTQKTISPEGELLYIIDNIKAKVSFIYIFLRVCHSIEL
jgi:hypothetical protein